MHAHTIENLSVHACTGRSLVVRGRIRSRGGKEGEVEGAREARQMSISMMHREERPQLGRE